MKTFLYTENFETNCFDIYVFEGEKMTKIPEGVELQRRIEWFYDHGAGNDIDDQGIAVGGSCGVKIHLAFKMLINQKELESGRRRFVFGSTDDVWFSRTIAKNINSIVDAVDRFLKNLSLTAPIERLGHLRDRLDSACRDLSKKVFFKKVLVATATVASTVAVSNLSSKPRISTTTNSDIYNKPFKDTDSFRSKES